MVRWAMAWGFAALTGLAFACSEPRDDEDNFGDTDGCPVGSETCPCTSGGGCDPGLECRSGLCVEGDDGSASASGGTTTTTSGPGSTTSASTTADSTDDGPIFDVGTNDVPLDNCEQDVDVVFSMDVSTTMTFMFDALLADMAEVDAALQALNANPQYGLVVFVDDYAVVNGGQPYTDIGDLQAEFQTWKVFTTSFSEPQITGGMNTTYPENSLDALYQSANAYLWRPADSTLRLVIHATDDTFSEAPAVLDGKPVEHTYDETIAILQDNEVRVAAFAAEVGGSLFNPTNVEAGWFTPWDGKPTIPESTDGVVFLIDGIQNGSLSLAQAIIETVEEKECTPYPEG